MYLSDALAKTVSLKKEAERHLERHRKTVVPAYGTLKAETSKHLEDILHTHMQSCLLPNIDYVFSVLDQPVKSMFTEANQMLQRVLEDFSTVLRTREKSRVLPIFSTLIFPVSMDSFLIVIMHLLYNYSLFLFFVFIRYSSILLLFFISFLLLPSEQVRDTELFFLPVMQSLTDPDFLAPLLLCCSEIGKKIETLRNQFTVNVNTADISRTISYHMQLFLMRGLSALQFLLHAEIKRNPQSGTADTLPDTIAVLTPSVMEVCVFQ